MSTATASDRRFERAGTSRSLLVSGQARASRIVIGTLEVLVALAGIEHGIGEILQGSNRLGPRALRSAARR